MAAKVPSHKRDDDIPPKTKGPGSPARFKGVPRGPARSFKEGALKKAMKVVAKLGGGARIELMLDGRIIILTGQDHPTTQAGDDLDKWMAEKNARQA
jgi:hypothetical protein